MLGFQGPLRVFQKILILFFGFIWLIFIPTLFLLLTPFHVYRKIVMLYAKAARKDLGKMVNAQSTIMAIDDMQGKPECNVVIWFGLKGEMTVREFQKCFTEKVLDLRDDRGNLAYPEFRQYFKNSMGYLFWKWDEDFRAQNHISECSEFKSESDNKSAVTRDQVLEYNEKLLRRPWPLNQSPWQFLLIPNYVGMTDGGKGGGEDESNTLVLFHLHHGMGDGYSFLKMILYHMWGQSTWGQIARPKIIGDENKGQSLGKIMRTIWLPFRIPYDFSKQLLCYDQSVWHLPQKELQRKWRVVKTTDIPISFIKEIKNAHAVSFTAVLAAAVAGGLRKYFQSEQSPLPEYMHVFAPMPFPGHPDDKLRNHLTGCLISLPLGTASPKERIQFCQKHFQDLAHSTLPFVNHWMSKFTGSLPHFCKDVNKNYHAAGIFSNFPGNEEPIFIFDKEVTEFSYNVASLHGRTGFTFTILSYCQHVSIDLTIDYALLKNESSAQYIVECIREEFNVLWKLQNLP